MPVLDYLPFDFFFVGKKNCISNLFNCLAFSFCYLAKEPDPNWHTGWAAFPLALPAEAALLSYTAEMVWGWRHRPWFWDQLCYSQRVGCLWSNRLHKLQTCLFLSVKWVCEKGHQSPPFSHSLMFFSSELIFSYKAVSCTHCPAWNKCECIASLGLRLDEVCGKEPMGNNKNKLLQIFSYENRKLHAFQWLQNQVW